MQMRTSHTSEVRSTPFPTPVLLLASQRSRWVSSLRRIVLSRKGKSLFPLYRTLLLLDAGVAERTSTLMYSSLTAVIGGFVQFFFVARDDRPV